MQINQELVDRSDPPVIFNTAPQRAGDLPILNPSCEAREPAVPAAAPVGRRHFFSQVRTGICGAALLQLLGEDMRGEDVH